MLRLYRVKNPFAGYDELAEAVVYAESPEDAVAIAIECTIREDPLIQSLTALIARGGDANMIGSASALRAHLTAVKYALPGSWGDRAVLGQYTATEVEMVRGPVLGHTHAG